MRRRATSRYIAESRVKPARMASIAALLTMVAACGPFPRDAEGTTERIRQTGQMQAAVVSGTMDAAPARRAVVKLARGYGAQVAWTTGPAARLMEKLDRGDVDIIIGEFGRSAPISTQASLSDAIGQPEPRDGKVPVLRLARRKGENRLILDSDLLVAP